MESGQQFTWVNSVSKQLTLSRKEQGGLCWAVQIPNLPCSRPCLSWREQPCGRGFPGERVTTPALPLPGRRPSAGQHLGWGWLEEPSEVHWTHVFLLHITQSHVNFFKRKAWKEEKLVACKTRLCVLACLVAQSCLTPCNPGQAPLSMGFPSKNIFSGHHQMQLAKKNPEVSDKKLK